MARSSAPRSVTDGTVPEPSDVDYCHTTRRKRSPWLSPFPAAEAETKPSTPGVAHPDSSD